MKKNNVFIIGAFRSPYSIPKMAQDADVKNSGVFSELSPLQFGEQVLRPAVEKLGEVAEQVSFFRLGSHLTHKVEADIQAPAKVLSRSVKGFTDANAATFDASCNSGFVAMEDILRKIQLGKGWVGVALGLDMPSRCMRREVEATLRNPEDGKMLWHYADETAKAFGLTRDELDKAAYESAMRAWEHRGHYNIVPIRDVGEKIVLDADEGVKFPTLEAIQKKSLMPGCGLISRAHLCKNADGAGVVVFASERVACAHGFVPLARVAAMQSVASVPSDFSTVAISAVGKVLVKAGLTVKDVDVLLIEETSIIASLLLQTMGCKNVNPYGGATSFGHPYGATFIMGVSNLLSIMERENFRYGVLAVGATGSTGSAIVLERL